MMFRVRMLVVLTAPIVVVLPLPLHSDSFPLGCIPIDRAGYVIDSPGNYCFTKDIHTRLDLPDRRAESAIVEIRSSNVTVDMLGYRGGRGRLFIQSGGNGFKIATNALRGSEFTDIVIKNGVLSDFHTGIYFYATTYGLPSGEREIDRISDNTFLYKPSNIKIINVTFKRCKKPFYFWDTLPR